MGDSPTEEDVERVDSDYVDPDSTSRDDIRNDLEEAGIDGDARDAFADRMVTADDVVDDVRAQGDGLVTREDASNTVDSIPEPHAADREPSLVDDASQELGAASKDDIATARAQSARLVDEQGNIRSNPDLDPLGGGDGREIGPVSEVTTNTGGRGGGFREGVEPTGSGRGTYYIEDEGGNRYPLAEVQI